MQTLKVINAFSMLSYFFISVIAVLQITEDDYKAFQGIDPLTNCGNPPAMTTMCTNLGKPDGASGFVTNYPACEDYYRSLLVKKGGKDTVETKTKFLVCGWKIQQGTAYWVFGKGQLINHVMKYTTNQDNDFVPVEDIEYK